VRDRTNNNVSTKQLTGARSRIDVKKGGKKRKE
jgi:hypothetical protein